MATGTHAVATSLSPVRVPITIATPPGPSFARRGEPVRAGVPIPEGAVHGGGSWWVELGAEPIAAQSRVLDRWPDGSARWVLLDFPVDHDGAGARSGHAVWAAGVAPQPADCLVVARQSDALVVETGAGRFAFAPGSDLLRLERVPGTTERVALGIVLADGRPCPLQLARVDVDSEGPQHVIVALEGTARASGRGPSLACLVRVHMFRGLPIVRMVLRLRNPRRAEHPGGFWDLGSRGSVFLSEATLRILSPADPASPIRCSAEPGLPFQPYESPFELYQASSGGERWNSRNHINYRRRVPMPYRGYRLRSGQTMVEGLRATPIVATHRRAGPVMIAPPLFWQNFPACLAVDPAALELGLWPRDFPDGHELQGGEQKTFEVYLAFGDDPVTAEPLAWCRQRLIATATPEAFAAARAVPWLTTAAAAAAPEYERLVDAAVTGADSFERKREVVDEYGWRHFGDLYADHEAVFAKEAPLVSHYNNQYDAVAGLATQYMRKGDPAWWRLMAALARHVIDIDVYHTTEDRAAYNHGMFWHTYHYGDADTATHRSYPRAGYPRTRGGGPSADHNYSTGLMLYYFLTGDPDARETVVDLARYVIDLDDGRRTIFRFLSRSHTGKASASGSYSYHGPGRSPANSVTALLNGYRLTGDRTFIEKAEQLIRRSVHPHQDLDALDLTRNVEYRWFYLMFLQALGGYLAFKAARNERDFMYEYARASLLHYARWMAEHEYPYLDHPERLEFPNETWAAQDLRKSDVFVAAALEASSAERERFLERARFFFEHATAQLGGMPSRTLCRPVVIALSNGLPWLWVRERIAALPTAPPLATYEFGSHLRFVPQRAVAIRRAVWILAAAGGVALTVAAARLLHHLS